MEEDKKPEETAIDEPITEISGSEPDKSPKADKSNSRWIRFKDWCLSHKKWTVPAAILFLIVVLASIPYTRYSLAGTVRKTNIELKVVDATADTPVSGATVNIGSGSSETDSAGIAYLHGIKAGHHLVTISKKYYQSTTVSILAPIFSQKSTPQFKLTATGRQVKIEVTNLIDKTALPNVDIKVAGITAKTGSGGTATVVLPAGRDSQIASLNLTGYNSSKVTVKISGGKIQDNKYSLTPAGNVYFLSNLSGKIDVVKTNLDGSDRQTVLAGTGNEDSQNTVLLASRGWKYLALLSRRAGNNPSIYLIKTADDSLTTIDSGSAGFNLVGWDGNNFIYNATYNNLQLWQPGRQVLKSYNAETNKLTTLDQTTASGSDYSDYLSQQIGNVYAYSNRIYYTKQWSGGSNMNTSPQLAAKSATFDVVNPDGSGKTAIKSFNADSNATSFNVSLDARVLTPDSIELYFFNGVKNNFYTYANGQVVADNNETSSTFYDSSYPVYLLSPSGNQTFWSEQRDGKNTLFIGDQYGQSPKQIATLSDYSPYGWFTDNYLLVSRADSGLYIMAKDGKHNPIKISDYHQPASTYIGYGGGYGGL